MYLFPDQRNTLTFLVFHKMIILKEKTTISLEKNQDFTTFEIIELLRVFSIFPFSALLNRFSTKNKIWLSIQRMPNTFWNFYFNVSSITYYLRLKVHKLEFETYSQILQPQRPPNSQKTHLYGVENLFSHGVIIQIFRN